MKAKKMEELKELVMAEGLVFNCEERDLRKISFKVAVSFLEGLLNEDVNFTPHELTSHCIGGWVGISLCGGDNYGISRSVQLRER